MSGDVEERALAVFVPQAEAFVRSFRAQHESLAASDIPAHITINIPFVPDLRPDARLDAALTELFHGFPAFPFALTAVGRFPTVLYLTPQPEEEFRRLIAAVSECFPESPPYKGEFADVIPHMTVAYLPDAEALEVMGAALDAAAEEALPIRGTAERVALLEKIDGMWRERKSFRLGARD